MSRHLSQVTTDHETIRRRAEERGGKPAAVKQTHKPGESAGIIRTCEAE